MNKPKADTEAVTAVAGVLHIAPAKDRQVRKPDGSVLPAEGEAVNVDADQTYWLRRDGDGDVTISMLTDGDDA